MADAEEPATAAEEAPPAADEEAGGASTTTPEQPKDSATTPNDDNEENDAGGDQNDNKEEDKPEEPEPVYVQYIVDRVHGESFLPKEYRKGGEKHGVRPTFNEWEGEDVTQWDKRPPHWTCYLPPFVAKCPKYLEQNRFCEWAGSWGVQKFKKKHMWRKRLFAVGAAFNFVSLVLTIWSALAFSSTYSTLTRASFSRGEASLPNVTDEAVVTINIGFRAIAITDPDGWFEGTNRSTEDVSTFDNFCDRGEATEAEQLLQGAICGKCRDSSQMYMISTCLNLIIIFRNIFSDVTRMYPKYDLNCPNFSGSLMATFSVFLGFYTILTYRNRCFKDINDNVQSSTVDGGSGTTEITFDWWFGPGMTCLIIATAFRIVDSVFNYIVPTPSITRYQWERRLYEVRYGNDPALYDEWKEQEAERFINKDKDAEQGEAGDIGATNTEDRVEDNGSPDNGEDNGAANDQDGPEAASNSGDAQEQSAENGGDHGSTCSVM